MASKQGIILDSHGNPVSGSKPMVHERPATPGERSYDWGSIDLKPSTLASAVKTANAGDLLSLAMVVRSMMEGWPHLRAEFGKLKISVGYTKAEVLPDPDAINVQQMARNVELCKQQMRMFNRRRLAMQLVDARAYSVECQELGWANIDGKWMVQTIEHVDPECMSMDYATGRYSILDPKTSTYTLMEAYRYLLATNSEYSGHPFRGGQFRALVWWYLLYRQNLTELYAFLQIYGVPFRFATGDTTDKDAAEKMEAGLKKLGMDAYAVFDSAEGWQIEVKTVPEASHAIFKDVRDLANEEASKICVGQTLTASPGQSGSWALGTVHEGVAQRIRESACGDVSEAIEDGIFWPLIYFNFGPEAAKELPVYKFHCEPPEDLASIGKLYETLHSTFGMWTTIPLKHLHDRFGVPAVREIKDDEVAVPLELQKVIVEAMFGKEPSPMDDQPDDGKIASDLAVRPRRDAFEQIVGALSKQEAGGAFSREAAKIKNLIGKQVRAGASLTEAQNALASYVSNENGDPRFAELMYKILGVSKALGYYDAKHRAAQDVAKLK